MSEIAAWAGNVGATLSVRATIRKFVVAGQFIEVLRCFENGMTEEVSGWATAVT